MFISSLDAYNIASLYYNTFMKFTGLESHEFFIFGSNLCFGNENDSTFILINMAPIILPWYFFIFHTKSLKEISKKHRTVLNKGSCKESNFSVLLEQVRLPETIFH